MVGDPRAREAFAAELVDPHLPLDLADLLGDHRPELRPQDVLPGAPVVGDRRLRVRLALAAAAADHAGLDAVEPLVAERLEARARVRLGGFELRRELGVGQPGQDLRAVLGRLLPDRLAGDRVPAAPAIGRLAAAARRRVLSMQGTWSDARCRRRAGLVLRQGIRASAIDPHSVLEKVDTKVDTNAAHRGQRGSVEVRALRATSRDFPC